ncbi:hypothetical protein MBEHAL_2476 [Halarchaeum acidiphilum MH1-52-1]|uniref:Alpha/beta hydrolase n=1 Tax=Halarchaeum acidiphilum MH1-52-1 TaxID=1261545 RepID=U2YH22_9EURY|nr:alpha/beta hydrolase [Halarchaeum acidiphilum]GAD53716.1 hypothetical protein MBEHAL_2476 [Halarchaeum acidiphilum MH1-52-1]
MAHFETNDGVPIYYEDRGSGETILLIHGWTMNAEYWWQKNVDARLADTIPDATHVPIEESGHCPFWEESEKFNDEVAAFVG